MLSDFAEHERELSGFGLFGFWIKVVFSILFCLILQFFWDGRIVDRFLLVAHLINFLSVADVIRR